MKKIGGFWFGVVLTLSILFCVFCFEYADNFRGYNSIGGEFFTLALPLMIVQNRLKMVGQNK